MRNKIIIFIIIVLSIILIPKVKASEMIFGNNGTLHLYNGSTNYLLVSQSSNNLPKLFRIGNAATLNTGVIDLELSPASGNINVLDNNYRYLVFDICSNLPLQFNITNSSCNGSCLTTGTYSDLNLGGVCTADDITDANRRLIQVDIQKWYLNEVAEMLEASSYMTITNKGTYTNRIVINQVFLSDEDILYTYRTNERIISKLDSVASNINTLNSNINTQTQNIINNNNTNTQNIINNQNSNATQAHNDAVNTQNTIKDDSVDSPNTSINTIKGSLASNGVITSLVVLPVTLYQSILNSVNGTCNTFSLGSLYGTNLTIPCINVSNYLGTTLWGSIDVIISGIFIYMISRKMVKVFHQLSSLKEGDVLDG